MRLIINITENEMELCEYESRRKKYNVIHAYLITTIRLRKSQLPNKDKIN